MMRPCLRFAATTGVVALALSVSATARGKTFDVTTTADSGAGSLRQALLDAAANAGNDVVAVKPGLGTITLTSEIQWNGSSGTNALVLEGAGVKLDFGGAPRGLVDMAGKGLTIRDVTIVGVGVGGASTSQEAAPVYATGGPVRLEGCTISGNQVTSTSQSAAGAVFVTSGDLTIVGCTFADNVVNGARDSSGAVFAESGALDVSDSTITGNSMTSGRDGAGGAFGEFGAVTIRNSVVSGNSAQASNGAAGVFAESGDFEATDSRFDDDVAQISDGAGGAFAESGKATIRNCTFLRDTETGTFGAGGVYAESGDADVSDTTFGSDAAGETYGAGALFVESGTTTLTRCEFVGCTLTGAAYGAGGVYAESGDMTIADSAVEENSGQADSNGAGGLFCESGALRVSGSTVVHDSFTSLGSGAGGAFSEGGLLDVSGTRVAQNTANVGGNAAGGLFCESGGTTLDTTAVLCNELVTTSALNDAAGGLYNQSQAATITHCTFAGNTASGPAVHTSQIVNAILSPGGNNSTDTTVTDDPAGCTSSTAIKAYFLPRTLTLKIASPSSEKDSLIGSGYVDDGGGVGVDYTKPVTVSIGGWSRTITLKPNKKRTIFTFKDATLNFVLTPRVRKASLGFFTIKIAKTPLGAQIDAAQPVAFHFNGVGLTDAAGTVKLTNAKYKRGSRRGDILLPHEYPAHVIATVGGDKKDKLTYRGGLASGGTAPAQLGTVTFAFGGIFTRTIAGNQFVKAANGDTYTFKSTTEKLKIVVDFQRDFFTVDASGVELGPLTSPTTDVVIDAGDGAGAYRNVIRLSRPTKGATRTY